MNIFTTINPKSNFEAQNEALSSWASQFKVYSINTEEEIGDIRRIYPYVNFIKTNDIYEWNGKKMMKLNAILEATKKANSKYSCIINSDIILQGELKINTSLLDNGIITSTRYELDGDKEPYPFKAGYDVFIFDNKVVDILFNNNFVIGMPWWDFWIPVISHKMGLKIYHIDNKIFYHKTHKTNYNLDTWISFGEHLYQDIIVNLMDEPINVTVYEFCTSVKEFIESKHININL